MSESAPNRTPLILRALIGLVVSIATAESVLLAMGYPSNAVSPALIVGASHRDEALGWAHVPGVRFLQSLSTKGAPPIRVTYLDDGRRSTGADESPGNYSIALVGCSFVEGYGLTDSDTFGWHLQGLRPEARVLNLGVAGYGTWQSLLAAEKFFAQPDRTERGILVYGFADFHPSRDVRNPLSHRYWEVPGRFPLCTPSSCGWWEGKSMDGWWRLLRSASLAENAIDTYAVSRRTTEMRESSLRLIHEMRTLSVEHGYELVIAPVHLRDPSWEGSLSKSGATIVRCDSSLTDGEYFLPDGHPNATWSREFARCLDSHLPLRALSRP